jgi:hypothetical protein
VIQQQHAKTADREPSPVDERKKVRLKEFRSIGKESSATKQKTECPNHS